MKTFFILFQVAFIATSFFLAFYFYPQMPEQVATHWNIQGEPDSYSPRLWGTFIFPIALTFLILLFQLIPVIDPLKENYSKFMGYYNGFVLGFSAFIISLQLFSMLSNAEKVLPLRILLPAIIGVLFVFIGSIMSNFKRNWFVGIRTPWTLSSDKVWEKTHQLGGKLFFISGIISIAGVFFQEYGMYFVLIPLSISAIFLLIFSYFEFEKEKSGKADRM